MFCMISKAERDMGPICCKCAKKKKPYSSPDMAERNLNLSSLDPAVP